MILIGFSGYRLAGDCAEVPLAAKIAAAIAKEATRSRQADNSTRDFSMFLSFRTGVAARLSVGYHLYRKSEWAILVKSTTRAGDK
jgi:hypothetical protein